MKKYRLGICTLLFDDEEKTRLKVTLKKISCKQLGCLTQAEIWKDGFSNYAELFLELGKYYDGFSKNTEVTLIEWEPV